MEEINMTIEKVIDYVLTSPYNTNGNVLRCMLKELQEGDNPELDVITATAEDIVYGKVGVDKLGNKVVGTYVVAGPGADSDVEYTYVYNEASYNYALENGYFTKYYETYPNEDVDPETGEHTWRGAISSPGAGEQLPWVAIKLDNWTGNIKYYYDGVERFSWDVENKNWAIASVNADLGLPQFKMEGGDPLAFDRSKFKIVMTPAE